MQAATDKPVAHGTTRPSPWLRVADVSRRLRQAALVRHGTEIGVWVAFYLAVRALAG